MPRRASTQFYNAKAYRPNESVGYLMRQVLNSIVQHIDDRLAPHGLTHAQWAPLHKLLMSTEPCTVVELARVANVDSGAMTRLLDRLAAKGLCTRTRSSVDRRVVHVALTPAGVAAAQPVPEALSSVMNDHLAGFSRTEWMALKGYLARMLENGDALSAARGADRSTE